MSCNNVFGNDLQGDWKLSGLGLSTFLTTPTGEPPKWEIPQSDRNLPKAVQKDFDYLAPEYAVDETLGAFNDMYSLGCIIFACVMQFARQTFGLK